MSGLGGDLALGGGLVLFVATVGYAVVSTDTLKRQPAAVPGTGISYAPYVFIDRETGCEYLSTHTSTGLAPRLAADGSTHKGCRGSAR